MPKISGKLRWRLRDSTTWRGLRPLVAAGATGMIFTGGFHDARAFTVYDGSSHGNNLIVRLDVTTSYSNIFRVGNPSAVLTSSTGNPNGNDGDLNFQHGLVSNLFEIVPVLDVTDGNYGAHVSGEAYLNTSYLGTNQNDQPSTNNAYTIAKNTDFTSATRNIEGENAQFLDAFVYGSQHFGANDQQTVTLKVGRQTLLWGQSLFFSQNGIAGGQAPINLLTEENIPNAQTQQVIEPLGQAVLTYQPNQFLTFQGYYQFEWEPDTVQSVGAYFSSADYLGAGSQRYIVAPGVYAFHSKDRTPPKNNGSFGLSVQATLGNYDVGLYALRYDSHAPEEGVLTIGTPGPTPNGYSIGTYHIIYPCDIQLYGASLSTTVGAVNLAGEVSGRRNMPLLSLPGIVTPLTPVGANNDPTYAVGNTIAGQISAIYVSPSLPFDPGGITFLSEVAGNHVVSVTANKSELDPGLTPTAAQLAIVATPTYYSVLPNLDLNFPVGLFYNFYGRSEVNLDEDHGTGTLSLGVSATYLNTWTATLTYTDFLGAPSVAFNTLADRNYVEFNVQHTF